MIIIVSLLIFLLIIFSVFQFKKWNENYQHSAWFNKPHIRKNIEKVCRLYQGIDGFHLSKRSRECRDQSLSLTYGEINLASFVQLLEKINIKKNDIFYDLGSGVGKITVLTALMYPFKKVIGIELLKELYDAAVSVKNKLSEYPQIEFTQADFMMQDIQEADVIFINATAFFGPFWNHLSSKLSFLKKGTRVLLVTQTLSTDYFRLDYAGFLPMSWGMATVKVYEKI